MSFLLGWGLPPVRPYNRGNMDSTTKENIYKELTLQLQTAGQRHGCRSALVSVRIIDTDVEKPFVQFSLSGQIDLEEYT